MPTAGAAGPFQAVATLFGESASRIVVSVAPSSVDRVCAAAEAAGVPVTRLGTTGGPAIALSVGGQLQVHREVSAAESAWAGAIGDRMARRPTGPARGTE